VLNMSLSKRSRCVGTCLTPRYVIGPDNTQSNSMKAAFTELDCFGTSTPAPAKQANQVLLCASKPRCCDR
jgi:hypothetical protein